MCLCHCWLCSKDHICLSDFQDWLISLDLNQKILRSKFNKMTLTVPVLEANNPALEYVETETIAKPKTYSFMTAGT